MNFDVLVDPGQENVLSESSKDRSSDRPGPDTIDVEWETGILPGEFSGDGSAHFFPKWAWPSEGDRVWVNGHWIFDCGHIDTDTHQTKTEIHPPRAIASMRQQFRTLPGSGTTPVAVTATDLYIHGKAGAVVDILECGQEVLLGETAPACPNGIPFGSHDPVTDHLTTPINEDFQFDICLPSLPFDKAVPKYLVELVPGNDIVLPARSPVLSFVPAAGACASSTPDPNHLQVMLHVMIPLADRPGLPNVTGDLVYARKISVGWIYPPDDLHHFQVSLQKGNLHDDLEHAFDVDLGVVDLTDDPLLLNGCECSFFWANLDRAPEEWGRLADFAEETCTAEAEDPITGISVCIKHNSPDDWDDDSGPIGDGELNFSGPTWDFYIGNGESYTIRANGYDEGFDGEGPTEIVDIADCFDKHFGEHDFASHVPFAIREDGTIYFFPPPPCYLSILSGGALDEAGNLIDVDANGAELPDNDPFDPLIPMVVGPPYNVGPGALNPQNESDQYDLSFNVTEIPLTDEENSADLVLTKDCKPDQGALAVSTTGTADSFTCTILVENPQGPALPRNVIVHDTMLTNVDPTDYVLEPPTFTFNGLSGFEDPCITDADGDGQIDNPMEEIPGGKEFTCNVGTVPIGGKAIVTMHIRSREGGDFDNFADVFSETPDPDLSNNSDSDSVHVTSVADLSISKTDSEDPLTSGTSLTYNLEVFNNGPSKAVNVVVEDFLPAGVRVDRVTAAHPLGAFPSCLFGVPGDVSRPTSCLFDGLAAGDSASMTIEVTALPGQHQVLLNEARVHSDVLDLMNIDDVDSERTDVNVADLQITKTSNADIYKPSSTVGYKVTVANVGPGDAANVVVTDNLPSTKQAIYVFDTGQCTTSGLTLTCPMGAIGAGTSKTFYIYETIKGSKGQVTNVASATSSTTDPSLANNSSTRVVLIKGGIKVGMAVVSRDGASVGSVKDVKDSYILVDRPELKSDVYVPWNSILNVTDRVVMLKVMSSEIDKMGWASP